MSPWSYTLRDDLTCRDVTIIAYHHHTTRLVGAFWTLWGASYHKVREHRSTSKRSRSRTNTAALGAGEGW